MDLSVQHLRYFLAVAENLHFTRAASTCHITPSSLSQQINALERRVGSPLFTRTSRQVTLTERGVALVPLARAAVDSLDAVLAWADPTTSRTPVVRIGMVAANPRIDRMLTTLIDNYPDVSWEVRVLGFDDALRALPDDEVDVAFTFRVDSTIPDSITAVPVWSESRVVIVSDRHPLASRAGVRLGELRSERFIGIKNAPITPGWFSAPGEPEPEIRSVASHFDEVLQLCAAGAGLNIAGSDVATHYARPGLRFVPITDTDDVVTYLCRRSSSTGPLVRAVELLATTTSKDR